MPPGSLLPLMIGPLGMQEILVIFAVALIIFGPRKLPQIGKTLGRSIAEFRKTSTDLRNTLEREVQMDDFRRARDEVGAAGRDFKESLDPSRGEDPLGPRPPPRPKTPESESFGAGTAATGESEPADGGTAATSDPETAKGAERADGAKPDGGGTGGDETPRDPA